MSWFPKSLSPLRRAIAELLSSTHHAGKLYCTDDIAAMLNLAADAGECAISFNTPLITRAFVYNSETEYILSYKDCFDGYDNNHLLYIQMHQRTGRLDMTTSIGCFRLFVLGKPAGIV